MKYIELSKLKPHPKNDFYFDMEDTNVSFEMLKNSILQRGLEEPIKITENNIIVSGHRRYKAYQDLGEKKIPCVVFKFNKKNPTEDDIEIALIESNLTQRGATQIKNKLKLGRCINKICEYYGLENGNNQYTIQKRVGNNFLPFDIKYKTKSDLAKEFGVSIKTLNDYQSLANATLEVQQAVEKKEISTTDGIKISRLQTQEQKSVMQNFKETGILPKKENGVKKIPLQSEIFNKEVSIPNVTKVKENPWWKNENETESISVADFYSFLKHGTPICGNDEERFNELLKYAKQEYEVEDLKYIERYKKDVKLVFDAIIEIFEKDDNELKVSEIETIRDSLVCTVDELRDIVDILDTISDYIDGVSEAVMDILDENNYEYDDVEDIEITDCDEKGFLYVDTGKQVGQIEEYGKSKYKFTDYNYHDKENNAYDKDGHFIGKIKWFIRLL